MNRTAARGIRYLLLLLVLAPVPAFAAVLRVPEDYLSIVMAMQATDPGDTVLVAPGEYTGTLTAPSRDITVASHYLLTPDSALIDSTILRPSPENGSRHLMAPWPDSLCRLRLVGFSLQGGATDFSMIRGGIECNNRRLNVEHCILDSCLGDYQGGALHVTAGTVEMSDCRIRHCGAASVGLALMLAADSVQIVRTEFFHARRPQSMPTFHDEVIRITQGTVSFRDCVFHGSGQELQLGCEEFWIGQQASRVELVGCEFYDEDISQLLGGLHGQVTFRFDSCSVHDCRIFDNLYPGGQIVVDSGATALFRDNIFANCSSRPSWVGQSFFAISEPYCPVVITGNLFLNNYAGGYSCLLIITGDRHPILATVRRNYFIGNSSDTIVFNCSGPIALLDSGRVDFRQNVLMQNAGYAVHSAEEPFQATAAMNYWGHASGPYHATANPDGRGDTVDAEVEVRPWYSDTTFLAVPEPEPEQPLDFLIGLAYPNPFNSRVTVEYVLTSPQRVTLAVYDLLGREVAVLEEGAKGLGIHRVQWDAQEQASGVYFARLSSASSRQRPWLAKLVLVK